MEEIKSKKEYNDKFVMRESANSFEEKKLRLEQVLDIRKYEIDLYWKRATYFWTFIAATLTGYGLTQIAKESVSINKFQFIIVCLGLIFSFAWYLVNRASKYWQENWEKHLDMLEDEIIGPLYKTTIHPSTYSRSFSLTGALSHSVSRINILLSFFVFLIWIATLIELFVSKKISISLCAPDPFYTFIGVITIAAFIFLIRQKSQYENTKVHFLLRKIRVDDNDDK